MRKICVIALVLLASVMQSFAVTANDPAWQKANTLYEQKTYDSAAYYYEQAAVAQPQNAAVYYNLGNTYYRLNSIPNAVLNYEKALRLKPDYKDAKDNLLVAQSRIKNRIQPAQDIFFITWWHSLTQGSNASVWATVALLLFLTIIIILLLKRFSKIKLPVQVTGLLSFIWIICLLLAFTASINTSQHDTAVVMLNDAPLMNGEQKGKPLSLVPEGTTVRVKGEKNSWAEVQLPDGRVGWLQQAALSKI